MKKSEKQKLESRILCLEMDQACQHDQLSNVSDVLMDLTSRLAALRTKAGETKDWELFHELRGVSSVLGLVSGQINQQIMDIERLWEEGDK